MPKPNSKKSAFPKELEKALQARCKELAQSGSAPSDIMEMAMTLDENCYQMGLAGGLEVLHKVGFLLSKIEKEKFAGLSKPEYR